MKRASFGKSRKMRAVGNKFGNIARLSVADRQPGFSFGGWPFVSKPMTDPEALVAFREAMKPEPGRNQYSIDSNRNDAHTPKGTTRAYTLSRLEREAPELFDRARCVAIR